MSDVGFGRLEVARVGLPPGRVGASAGAHPTREVPQTKLEEMEMSTSREKGGLRISDCGWQHPASRLRHATFLLALASLAALGLSSAASAAIISFENPPGPGHFVWPGGVTGSPINLDFRFAAFDQPGASNSPATSGQFYSSANNFSRFSGAARYRANASTNPLAIAVNAGTLIDSTGTWVSSPYISNPAIAGISMIPEGVETFLAARFNPNGAIGSTCSTTNPSNPCHYGWVQVVRTGFDLDALAWAYEDVPATPIAAGAVPEPGTLSLLALGAIGAISRRRRSRA